MRLTQGMIEGAVQIVRHLHVLRVTLLWTIQSDPRHSQGGARHREWSRMSEKRLATSVPPGDVMRHANRYTDFRLCRPSGPAAVSGTHGSGVPHDDRSGKLISDADKGLSGTSGIHTEWSFDSSGSPLPSDQPANSNDNPGFLARVRGSAGQNCMTSRPRVPPACSRLCASPARSGGYVAATRSVRTPASTCPRNRSSFSNSQS